MPVLNCVATLFPFDDLSEGLPPGDLDRAASIDGLRYVSDYLSAEEEMKLVGHIDGATWDTTWVRRRQLYGWSYGKGLAEAGCGSSPPGETSAC